MQLRVATFNIRNITDRYKERRPLLEAAFAAMSPELCGLQEVIFSEPRQDDILAAAGGRAYRSFDVRSGRHPMFGNAILCATGEVQAHETLTLSHQRVAQRVLVALPGGRMLWFANTHLHDPPADTAVRVAQVEMLLQWMADAPAADATAIAGDFNMNPREPAYAHMTVAGWRSAFLEANGSEPAVTWPSGIQAPTMDTDGDPNCLDYIWLKGAVRADSASLAANQHAAADPTLYPSDHFAIVATLEVG